MSKQEVTVELSEDQVEELNQVQYPEESQTETVQRILQHGLEAGPQHRFQLILISAVFAVIWLSTFVFIGVAESNAIGGLYIVSVVFWALWQELQFRWATDYRG